jgi:hypothetical protein
MADWRQIQARIRKAKTGTDPLIKLGELFAKTHDAMVAWEMAVIEEKAGNLEAAIGHFTVAVERFRRSEWKKKAEEALTRLGAPIPVSASLTSESRKAAPSSKETPAAAADDGQLTLGIPGPASEPQVTSEAGEPSSENTSPAPSSTGATEAGPANGLRRRRRGRRGGRGRRRPGSAATPGLPAQTFAPSARAKESAVEAPPARSAERPPERAPERDEERPSEKRVEAPVAAKRAESEAPTSTLDRMTHTRPGEPALASRLAQLESLLRRLTSGPLHTLDEAEEAPAGPGVYLLSDSDLITSYYVEDCKTLRVALGHLVRGGRGAQRETSVRSRLAEHLEISEAKVSQYLKQHCAIRWIQLDEQAPYLAHFAIAVLRPPLNFESL